MDNNTGQTTIFTTVKSFAIEIGIILFLTAIVIGTLNFLKVIDIKALFSPQSNTVQVAKIPAITQTQPKPSGVQNRVQGNPYLQNIALIAQNKGLHYAQIVSEFEGKIKTINTTGGTDPVSKQKYQIRLELTIGTSSATTVQLYPQEAVSKIKILDAKKKELILKDLKAGDTLTIQNNIGALRQYPNNFNEIVITKM